MASEHRGNPRRPVEAAAGGPAIAAPAGRGNGFPPLTLTAGLGTALVFGHLAHRLRLSPIIGFLLAGIAIGPHTPGFVADQEIAGQFAEIGRASSGAGWCPKSAREP